MLADMAAQMQQLRGEKEELLGRNTLLESLLKVATQVQIKCIFTSACQGARGRGGRGGLNQPDLPDWVEVLLLFPPEHHAMRLCERHTCHGDAAQYIYTFMPAFVACALFPRMHPSLVQTLSR